MTASCENSLHTDPLIAGICPECQYLAAERAAIQLEHLIRTERK